MYVARVTAAFDSAHFCRGIKGAEAQLHGHTWHVEVTFTRDDVDELGMIAHPRDLQRAIVRIIAPFEHDTINKYEPFDEVSPTPWTVARYIFEGVEETLKQGAPDGLEVRAVKVSAGGDEAVYVPDQDDMN